MELGLLTLGDHVADPATGVRTAQAERHRDILEYLDFAEPAGFDVAVVGEHHFSDFIVSVPQVFLAWVAARTSTIRLATGVTLLPHHDPVRLAEDFATLDVVSNGRAEVWVGKGHPRVTLNAHVHVAPTTQEARAHLRTYQFGFQKWVFSKKTGVPINSVELPPRVLDLDSPTCAIVSGSPDEVADRIGALNDTCDFDRFVYQGDHAGQPWPLVKRSLDLFATHVIAQLHRTAAALVDASAR